MVSINLENVGYTGTHEQHDNKCKLWCTLPSKVDWERNTGAHHFTRMMTNVNSGVHYPAKWTGAHHFTRMMINVNCDVHQVSMWTMHAIQGNTTSRK